jgi:DNA helicase-2/ATP-dependent DNA helicase PcrA
VNSPDPVTVKTVGQYRRQLEVYAHLVEQQTGQRVSKLHLYYPKEENGNPYVTWPVSRTGVEATVAGFENVVRKIEAQDFGNAHIVKSERQCGSCDMRYFCNPRHYTLKD